MGEEWKVKAFCYLRQLTYLSPSIAKDIVDNLVDYQNDGYSPEAAVREELSYWSD